jgi:hypothetical protein
MTKRGRKLHQTMARRYAIARGENPDPNSQWNLSDLKRAVDIAWKAYQEWCAKAYTAVQHFFEVIEPWYEANREAIDAAIQSDPASVQRQILDMQPDDHPAPPAAL